MKVIAFGASNSTSSINKQFASHAASYFNQHQVEILDLNNYSLPIYSMELEKEKGIPQPAKEFTKKLLEGDLIIISLAEHNGNFSAAFKNLFDWSSRLNVNMFENKAMLLLSTSPGPRGGLSSLNIALDRFPRHGANIVGQFSLPSFMNNFKPNKGIVDNDLKLKFEKVMEEVKGRLIEG